MIRILAIAALAAVLAGCGKQAVSDDEAMDIAALSQDAASHSEKFATAILELSKRDDCSADFMREYGGFSKVSGQDYYFLYCGEPMNKARRWHYDPASETLTRYPAEI